MTIAFQRTVPIIRILDVAKADEFYLGYAGFAVDWAHRFDGNAPLYRQISRGGLVLHRSEHHGDGIPGAHIRIEMTGIEALHAELAAKNYRYMRPGLQIQEWGWREVTIYDPFGNRLIFCERVV